MAAVREPIYLLVLGAVLYTPVTSQAPFQQQANNRFASFNRPQSGASSAFLPPQSPSAPRPQPQVPSQLPVNQRNQQLFRPLPTQSQQQLPSQFLAQQTAQLPRNTDNVSGGGRGSRSGQHTYPDGTMGGDYPTRKAEKLLAAQRAAQLAAQGGAAGSSSGQHTYPDGTMGGDYPKHKAAQKLAAQQAAQRGTSGLKPGQHTYPDGTMGGDYPKHKAAQKLAAQQAALQTGNSFRSQQGLPAPRPQLNANAQFRGNVRGFGGQPQLQQGLSPNRQFAGNLPTQTRSFTTTNNNNKPSSGGEHTYPDGTTGGDYPTHKAAKQAALKQQQLQKGRFTNSQFTGNFPVQTGGFSPSNTPAPGQHTYPDGTMGGDYPTHKAALEKARKQQQLQQGLGTNSQFVGNFPVQTGSFPPNNKPAPGQHTYPDGTTGGDYPKHKAALEKAKKQQQLQQGLGTNSQFVGNFPVQTGSFPPNNKPAPGQHTYPDGTTGGDYPTHKAALEKAKKQKQLNTNGKFVGGFAVQPSNLPFNNNPVHAGQHTYPDGTTGGDYPKHKAAKQAALKQGNQVVPKNTFDLSRISAGGDSFFTPQSGRGSGGQCFEFRDLAAGYGLSDTTTNYPMDAIMSELRARPHLAPMAGYEHIQPQTRRTSPFSNFGSFQSLEFQNTALVEPVRALSNVKHFPANYDKDTLHQSMDPQDRVCPSVKSTLRALTIDGNRCSIVNADYQGIMYTKCKRRECSLCGVGQGVNICMPHYNWVSVMVYCPHWQRDSRIKTIKLYLPQGCTCNRYRC